ncbi:phage antirepressor KilAC domain-containing protein [Psychrobacter sp.]|uniref:phage antirepressor KilAC domain-containing protein n=1 Tax=Psychrobacter sp. TaxID=56811 RepID=UPI003C774D68
MNILTQSTDTKMTSQQIAELVEKRHDSVKRTIDYLVKESAIQLPHHAEVKNHLGQSVGVYVFSGEQGRLDSITVVAQLSPTFTAALVKRWDELERGVAQPQIPQSFAEALQLAANQALQIEQNAPKVAHYDKVVDRHTLLTATQVGQKIGLSAIMLNRVLVEIGVYNKAHKRGKAFKQWFIDKGLGEMKQTDMGYSQPLFSLKGEAWVIERLASEGAA